MKRILVLTVILAASVLPFAPHVAQAVATTWYVATGGSDAAAGTVEAPFLTIQHAVDVAAPDDTITITAGTYAENVDIDGESDLVIQGVGDTTIIEPASGIGFAITTSNDITIKNLKIHTNGLAAHGIWVAGTPNAGAGASNNLTVQGTTIIVDGYSTGIYAEQVTPAHVNWLIGGGVGLGNTIEINDGTGGTGDGLDLHDVSVSSVSYNTITLSPNHPASSTNVLWTSERSNLGSLVFSNNTVSGSTGSQVAIVTDFVNNEDPLVDTSISSVTISSNTFSNWGSRAIKVGTANGTGTVSGIGITNNTFEMAEDFDVIGGTAEPDATGSGNTFNVSALASVETAVDTAFAGDTVHVAAGNYSLGGPLDLDKEGVQLIGDDGDEAYLISTCDYVARITAPGVHIEHLFLWQKDDGTFDGEYCSDVASATVPVVSVEDVAGSVLTDVVVSGGTEGVVLDAGSSGTEISNSTFAYNADAGISIEGSTDNTISDNTISYNTTGTGVGIIITCEEVDIDEFDCELGGTDITSNSISSNTTGVLFEAGDQLGEVNLGPDNTIQVNSADGVYVDGDAGNFYVNGNGIYNNPGLFSGLHVQSAAFLDASGNWWGDASGPKVNGSGPGTAIESETINTFGDPSDIVFYRPFCIDSACDELSTADVSPAELTGLFTSGTFDIGDQDPNFITTLVVTEDVIITVGDSSVEIPAGTTITRTGGGLFDGSTMDAAEVAVGDLSGMGSGVVAQGAMQWGAAVGLTFNPAIILHIFVGTDLDGQTLNVKRSPDGLSGWTSDGIVAPATCLVGDDVTGVCDFQATKASTYASTTSSGGGSGSYAQASPTPTPFPGLPGGPDLHGLREGDVIRASAGDIDVYIVNAWGFKRLFLNPVIFNFYGHLGGWSVVKSVLGSVRDAFPVSGLFRNCETNDQAVYALEVTGEDTGVLHHVNMSGDQAVAQDPNFFHKVFCINSNESNWYAKSPTPYTSLMQLPVYHR